MTGLNTKYVPLSTIQEAFINKLTGSLLANGVVSFYEDNSRTTPKDVFNLTGTPPDYTYTPIGSTLPLSSIGTFTDTLGNNIIPYLLPYVDETSDEISLYFITVYDANGMFQFSVGGIPNVSSETSTSQINLFNFIPNGQFLLNNSFLNSGAITALTTDVCYGGWQFVRQTNVSEDAITFPRFASPISNPTGNPRYACEIACTLANTNDISKIFQIVFDDVNRFSDPTQEYTLFFSGQSNASAVSIPIILYKFFGTGGSEPISTIIGNVELTTSYSVVNVPFTFGSNAGMVLGANDDDYFAIQLSLPARTTFDISVTDFALVPGKVTLTSFPVETDSQIIRDSLGGAFPIPDPSGNSIGLPPILTLSGWQYDSSQVGKICATIYTNPAWNEVLCDGTSYDTTTRNSAGIPYSRIASLSFNYTHNMPQFGTGESYFTATQGSSSQAKLIFNSNSAGMTQPLADGIIQTGFTFNEISTGYSNFDFSVFTNSAGIISIINKHAGRFFDVPVGLTREGTSGFNVLVRQDGEDGINGHVSIEVTSIADLVGKYFLLTNTVESFYFWFTVDGIGTDPMPFGAGTSIHIDILSIHDINDVIQVIKNTVAGYSSSSVTFTDAGNITAGSYFTFENKYNDLYYVWYKINGIGVDPNYPGAKKGIMVTLIGNETAEQVARDTQYFVNSSQWAAPDFRGAFLRAWTSTSTNGYDPDTSTRLAGWNAATGNSIGSFQPTGNLSHTHTMQPPQVQGIDPIVHGSIGWASNNFQVAGLSMLNSGGNQSNPANFYVNYVIKI